MVHYQLSQLDLSTRIGLAVRMLDPDRSWGEVTQLARSYGTSRKFLYLLRDRTAQAIQASLAPQMPGPQRSTAWLQLDRHFLQKAILILSLLPPSLRNLQRVLALLFGQACSLGYIQRTLQGAGERARADNQRLQPTQPILAEADEIFKTRRPCLTVVDGRSFLVLNLARQADCDQTTWGVTLLDLLERGIQFEDLACDSAWSLQAGIRAAQLTCPLRADLFHLFQEGGRIAYKLEWRAYRALRTAFRAQRAEQEAHAEKRRSGRPLKVKLTAQEAMAQAERAMNAHDRWVWLFAELRQTLQPFDAQGGLTSAQQARQNLGWIVEWMQALQVDKVTPFANHLAELADRLIDPLAALEQRLADWRTNLPPQTAAFLLWAWQHRQPLELQIERDFPPALQPVAHALWQALADFHRTSSLAEALHSWLRPFLDLHRSMPDWLLALLQGFWNHHTFLRGKRKGHSPLALVKIATPSLAEWLDSMLCPEPTAVESSSWIFKVPEKCYPISF